jgi:hypothetical protein
MLISQDNYCLVVFYSWSAAFNGLIGWPLATARHFKAKVLNERRAEEEEVALCEMFTDAAMLSERKGEELFWN